MKTQDYITLNDLKHEIIVTLDTHNNIFFRMRHLMWNGNPVLNTRNISKINKSMPDGKYWIAYNHVVTKGKQEFFRKDVVCVCKEEIIKIFQSCVKRKDFFDLIMEPIFEYEYQFVVTLDEHGIFHKKIKNK
jgi:hypothetical protein